MLKHNVEPGKINPGKPWNSLVNCSELVIIYWIVPSRSMYRVFHRKFIMWVLFAGYNGGTNCVRYDAGSWSESHNLTKSRIGHIMWKSSQADIELVSYLCRCFRHKLCVVWGVVMVCNGVGVWIISGCLFRLFLDLFGPLIGQNSLIF